MTGCHLELDGGQAQHWSKTAGFDMHSKALCVHNAASLCRKWGCRLFPEGRNVKNFSAAFCRGLRLCDHGYRVTKSADVGYER